MHFKSDDIISTFDHCINGQILKIQRDRPRLKPNALPCLEMTSEQELVSGLKFSFLLTFIIRGQTNTYFKKLD